MKTQILVIANQKGGVGKTTTALSLSAALSILKKKVLLVDLDPHGCATVHLSIFQDDPQKSVHQIFRQDLTESVGERWEGLICRNERFPFDFIPSHVQLADLDVDLKDVTGKGTILLNALQALQGQYDYIVIDCPPYVGVLLINALISSDLLIIPIQTDFLALHGLRLLFKTIRIVNKATKRKIKFKTLATMFDQRASACRRVLHLLQTKVQKNFFKTVINIDTKFREASAQGRVIYEVAPASRGAKEYLLLAKEIVRDERA